MPRSREELAGVMTALRAEIDELANTEEPTDEQNERLDAAITEFDAAQAEDAPLAKREAGVDRARAAFQASPSNRESGFGANVLIRKDPFEDLMSLRHADPRDQDVIARAETALTDVKTFVSDLARESAIETVKRVPGAAVHALVHASPAYEAGWRRWMAAAGMNPNYTEEEQGAIRTALSLTGANGGFTLPTLFDPSLIKTGVSTYDPIRDLARVETITQNVWNGVSVGNVTAFWTAEAAAFTDGSPTFAHPSVTAAKLTAFVPGSIEVWEDSTAIDQLPSLIAEGMSYVENTAFISGSGSNAPRGVITAVSGTAGSLVTATTRGSFTAASSSVDVYAVVNAVSPRFQATSTWVANNSFYNVVNQMSPSGGGSLYWGNLSQQAYSKPPLLGYQTVQATDMTAAASFVSGTIGAILGDFSRYLIVDRIGVTVEFIQNLVNSSQLPTGQRALVCHKRVGGDVTDVNAFRLYKL